MAARVQYSHYFFWDSHLYPLYMKLAADNFNAGKTREGMNFFQRDRGEAGTFTSKVYEQMWKIKSPKKGDHRYRDLKYGEKSFYGLDGLSSTADQKAKAIYASLVGVNPEELQMQENKIHEILWEMHKRPLGDHKYGEHAFNNSHGCYASDSDKEYALSQHLWYSRLFTWCYEDKEIRLLRSGKGLKFQGLDLSSGRTCERAISLGDVPIEERISQLAELDVTLNSDNLDFSQLIEYVEWPSNFYFNGRIVKMFRRDNQLIWHTFESYATKTSSWIFADNDSKHALNYLATIWPNKREAYVRENFNFDMKFDISTRKLLSVSIKCRDSLPSKVNSKEIAIPINETCVGQTYVGKTPFDLNSYSFPLYLYLAAKSFDNGKTDQGMKLFEYARGNPRTLEHGVYRKMWEIKCPKKTDRDYKDSKYGEKCFHGVAGKDRLSSSDQEKAQAIHRSLNEAAGLGVFDREELEIQENEIYESLGKLPGSPTYPGDLERGKKVFYDLNKCPDVSFDVKASAIACKLPTRVFTFFSEDGVINFLRRGDTLKYQVFNDTSGKTWYDDDSCGDLSIENRISLLAERVLYFVDDAPYFLKLTPCKAWPNNVHHYSEGFLTAKYGNLFVKHRKVNLSLLKGKYVWHVIDLTEKTSSWIPAGSDAHAMMEHLSECEPHIREIKIARCYDIQMGFQSISRKLVSASIKPRVFEPVNTPKISNYVTHASSQLDPNVGIDKDNWAFTLISSAGSSGIGPFDVPFFGSVQLEEPFFGHAQLVIEGIKNGRPFTLGAHLTDRGAPLGYATVKTALVSKILEYRKKSPTGQRPKAQLEKIIYYIEQSIGKNIPFNYTGNQLLNPFILRSLKRYFNETSRTAHLQLVHEQTTILRRKLNENDLSNADRFIADVQMGLAKPNLNSSALKKEDPLELSPSYEPFLRTLEFEGNCLTWVLDVLSLGGIKLPPIDTTFAVPEVYIQQLNSQKSL